MSNWYILDNENKPVRVTDSEYQKWVSQNGARKITGKTNIGKVFVSTIFLGLEHGFGNDTGVLWESMIFGGDNDQYQEGHTSQKDAVEAHEFLVRQVIKGKIFNNGIGTWN